jgi:hypothetical protein
MPRDYRLEYDSYHAKPEQIANRSSRNKARRILAKKGAVVKGDGKEVDHKNMNPLDNRPKNLRLLPKSVNRKLQPPRKRTK